MMELDINLIILALETLKEQVHGGTDWNCEKQSLEGQTRLGWIDEHIDIMLGYTMEEH